MRKDSKLRTAETGKKCTCDVMNGKVGEYSIKLIKPHDAPEKGRFLVCEVSVNGKVIWNFKEEHFSGLALLVDLKGVPCICLVSREKEVKKIIPIDTLREKKNEEQRIRELEELAKKKIKSLLE